MDTSKINSRKSKEESSTSTLQPSALAEQELLCTTDFEDLVEKGRSYLIQYTIHALHAFNFNKLV